MRSIEAKEQEIIFKWASLYNKTLYAHMFAIPNGGSRNKIEAVNLKRQGVKAGISDIFIAYPNKTYHGLWIELKAPKPHKSNISQLQKDWIDLMNVAGYKACVCYGSKDAIDVIKEYWDNRYKIVEVFHE